MVRRSYSRICEHPEPPPSNMLLRELIQQARRMHEMHIVISASMGEEEVDVRECCNIIDCRLIVALRIG